MALNKCNPKDAAVMEAILKDMGVTDYEPRVVNQMMEFVYRYITDVLDDARTYSTHASKKNIDVEDVKLAIQYRLDNSYTTPPPRELLMDVARHKNNTPLPLIKPYAGLRLPPERHCFSSTNYRLKPFKKATRVQQQRSNSSSITASLIAPRLLSGNSNILKSVSSLGGTSLSVVTKAISMPTVSVRSAGAPTTPIIRVSSGPRPPGSSIVTSVPSAVTSSAIFTPGSDQNPLKRKRDDEEQ